MNSEMMKRFIHSAPVNIFLKIRNVDTVLLQRFVIWFLPEKMEVSWEKQTWKFRSFQKWEKCITRMIKKYWQRGEGSQYISEFPMEDGESLYFEIKRVQYEMKKVISSES
ncbi:MAG: hypothetical protein ACLS61_16700 [Ruminococcus sp.]